MRLPQAILFLLTLVTTIHALALPAAFESIVDSSRDLWKRKGGGGGGGKGGGTSSGGGSSGGGGSSSGGGRTGTSTGGGSTGGSRGSTPSYGGGRYYGGGAVTPYSAGQRSPGGIGPYILGGAVLGSLGGLYLAGAYIYPYSGLHSWHNNTSNQNETHPIDCVCNNGAQCGCDNNTNSTYLNDVANDGNTSQLVNVNGTDTLVINGTVDASTTTSTGAAGSLRRAAMENPGLWFLVAGVTYTMYFM